MTLTEKAERYAKQHPQEVTLAWIDNTQRTYNADKAARLCGIPRIAACLMGVVKCEDQTLEAMLNRLIDIDND